MVATHLEFSLLASKGTVEFSLAKSQKFMTVAGMGVRD